MTYDAKMVAHNILVCDLGEHALAIYSATVLVEELAESLLLRRHLTRRCLIARIVHEEKLGVLRSTLIHQFKQLLFVVYAHWVSHEFDEEILRHGRLTGV